MQSLSKYEYKLLTGSDVIKVSDLQQKRNDTLGEKLHVVAGTKKKGSSFEIVSEPNSCHLLDFVQKPRTHLPHRLY